MLGYVNRYIRRAGENVNKIRDLEVAFNGRIVLSIPNAVFNGNSVILGPNGAGKTTLLKTIVGLYKPLHGYIEVDGADTHKDSPYRLLSTNIETAYILPGACLNDLLEIYAAHSTAAFRTLSNPSHI